MSAKKAAAAVLAAAMSISVIASADEFTVDQKAISVIGGESPIWVTIMDEKHYDAESQGYSRIMFDDSNQPFIDENGRTQMPLRIIGDELGFTVDWNEDKQEITMSSGENNIVLHLNSNEITADDKTITMDTTPKVVNGTTFIPLRFMAESVGYTVEYTDRRLVDEAKSVTTPIEDMWKFNN